MEISHPIKLNRKLFLPPQFQLKINIDLLDARGTTKI